MDDEKIIALYWQRDETAIQETVSQYGGYCFAIAYGILNNHEDAQECVNDTYLSAWNSIPPHRPQVLSAFLGRITRNISLKRLRLLHAEKRGGGQVPLVLDELSDCISDGCDLEKEWQEKQLSELIDSFLRTLAETERRIFICRYWYMDSVASIAAQYQFSESKVKMMLLRTRKKLKLRLQKEGVFEE